MRKIFFIFKFIKIKPIKLRADISFFSFYVYRCFACVYVCVPFAYLTCWAQKGCQIPGAVLEGWEPPSLEGFGLSALVHVSISNIYVLFAVGRFLNSLGMLFQNRANKGSRAIRGFSVFFPSLSFPVGSGRIHCIMEVLKLTVLIQLTKAIQMHCVLYMNTIP